jgi:hypothetical protein
MDSTDATIRDYSWKDFIEKYIKVETKKRNPSFDWKNELSAEQMTVLIACFHAYQKDFDLDITAIQEYVKQAAQALFSDDDIVVKDLPVATDEKKKADNPKIRLLKTSWCNFWDDANGKPFEYHANEEWTSQYSKVLEVSIQNQKTLMKPQYCFPEEKIWESMKTNEAMTKILKDNKYTKFNIPDIHKKDGDTDQRNVKLNSWIMSGFGQFSAINKGVKKPVKNRQSSQQEQQKDEEQMTDNTEAIQETIDRMKRFSVKDGRIMKLILENNIKPPIGYRNYRPTIVQDCGGSVLTTTDGSVGSTYYIPIDFLMGEQPDTHVVSGMLNLYYRAVIKQPDRIARIYNCVFQKYKGGWGDRPLNILDSKETEDWVLSGRITKDVLCTPQLMGRRYTSGPVDITGRYGDSLSPSEEDERNNFLPGSSYYIKKLGLLSDGPNQDSHARYNPLVQTPENLAHVEFSNTLCFRDHQQLYDTNKKTFSAIRTCKGHFGEQVGPGFVDTLNGKAIVPLSFNYRNENKMVIV